MGSALPLIYIYLYTEFYLNATSSLTVICQTRYRTDRQTKWQLYASPYLGNIKILILLILKIRNKLVHVIYSVVSGQYLYTLPWLIP